MTDSAHAQMRVEKIRDRLMKDLSPEMLEVTDESQYHQGHAGAQSGGGHFLVDIKTRLFEGKTLIQMHQMVYKALAEMMQGEIHALRIKARS